MLLWVLQDNRPACRFYKVPGGKEVGEKTIEIGGANLVEVAYYWKDLTVLIDACEVRLVWTARTSMLRDAVAQDQHGWS